MKQILNIVLVATVMSFYSCKKELPDNTNLNIIEIEKLSKITDNGQFIDAIESIEFIPIEQTNEYLAGDIYKVIETDSAYFIMDRYDNGTNAQLVVIDKLGHYKQHISSQGQGPEEYARLKTFTMSDSILYLYDDYTSTILSFDKNNRYIGKLNSIEMISISDIACIGDGKSILAMGLLDNFNESIYGIIDMRTGQNKTLVHNPFNRESIYAALAGAGPLAFEKDSVILMTMPLSPVVYALDVKTHQISPFLSVDCGIEIPKPQEGENFDDYKAMIDQVIAIQRFPFAVFKTGKWVVLNFFMGSVLWDTSTQTGYHTLNPGSKTTSTDFPFLPYDIKGIGNDGSFISIIDADQLLDLLENVGHDLNFMPDAEIINKLTEYSNPVLIRYKMKQ